MDSNLFKASIVNFCNILFFVDLNTTLSLIRDLKSYYRRMSNRNKEIQHFKVVLTHSYC